MRSPTQRSMAYLRKRGYACVVVEKWLYPPGSEHGIRKDTWACDLLCVHVESAAPMVLVQTTSSSNHSARVHKMLEVPELRYWVKSGGFVELHSWGTRKKEGKEYWCGRIERGTLDAFGQLCFARCDEAWSVKRKSNKRVEKAQERASHMRGMYGGQDMAET